MPEYPDVTVYIERLEAKVSGQILEKLRLTSPFPVRSVDPPISACQGREVIGFRRLGKRIVFCLEDDLFLVLHLMVAGRLRWRGPGAKLNRRLALAGFDFPDGTLVLTEASKKKRASLHLVRLPRMRLLRLLQLSSVVPVCVFELTRVSLLHLLEKLCTS